MQSASRRPAQGVALAPFRTTVLPVTSAAAVGPPASATGKLKGAMTTHTPYGFITLRLRDTTAGIGSLGSAWSKPPPRSKSSQYPWKKSAVSCTSPSASMRFLPVSRVRAAASS